MRSSRVVRAYPLRGAAGGEAYAEWRVGPSLGRPRAAQGHQHSPAATSPRSLRPGSMAGTRGQQGGSPLPVQQQAATARRCVALALLGGLASPHPPAPAGQGEPYREPRGATPSGRKRTSAATVAPLRPGERASDGGRGRGRITPGVIDPPPVARQALFHRNPGGALRPGSGTTPSRTTPSGG